MRYLLILMLPLLVSWDAGDRWAARNSNPGAQLFIFPGISSDPSIASMQISSNTTIGSGEFMFAPAIHVATGVTLTVNGVLWTYQLSGPGTVAGTGIIVGN